MLSDVAWRSQDLRNMETINNLESRCRRVLVYWMSWDVAVARLTISLRVDEWCWNWYQPWSAISTRFIESQETMDEPATVLSVERQCSTMRCRRRSLRNGRSSDPDIQDQARRIELHQKTCTGSWIRNLSTGFFRNQTCRPVLSRDLEDTARPEPCFFCQCSSIL